jgi:hypothetical protein
MTIALALAAGIAYAGDKTSSTTDPGFNPNNGQINPGHAPAPWSATAVLPQDNWPPQQQARAALMMPDPVGISSLGAAGAAQSTTGTGGSIAPATPAPIGATVQTMPAKFSKRNDLLDHLPVMSWPLRLSDEQQRQIYQAVMADRSHAAPNADALKPASALPYEQARDMHPLPQELSGIDGLQGLQYVKGKKKVLLVRPSVGIVVDEIAS